MRALDHPYGAPTEASCGVLGAEVQELDVALGPDLDAKASAEPVSLAAQGLDQAKGAAVGVLRNTTENVIPFRDWVRKLSGAEAVAKKAADAVAAGVVRRAFLKGMRVTKECV